MEKKGVLPKICPSCGEALKVHTMHCTGCDTKIVGEYARGGSGVCSQLCDVQWLAQGDGLAYGPELPDGEKST